MVATNRTAMAWLLPANMNNRWSPLSGLLGESGVFHILFYVVPWTGPTSKEKEGIKKGRHSQGRNQKLSNIFKVKKIPGPFMQMVLIQQLDRVRWSGFTSLTVRSPRLEVSRWPGTFIYRQCGELKHLSIILSIVLIFANVDFCFTCY